MTLVQECTFDPPHEHEFPDDWVFGGPSDTDPRADERFHPEGYQYFDERLNLLTTTSAYLCDDEALDAFTKVANYGPDWNPKYIAVRRRHTLKYEMMPWTYDKTEDMVTPL